jgi:hypothetical protein
MYKFSDNQICDSDYIESLYTNIFKEIKEDIKERKKIINFTLNNISVSVELIKLKSSLVNFIVSIIYVLNNSSIINPLIFFILFYNF